MVAALAACSNNQSTTQQESTDDAIQSSDQRFVNWLKDYIPAEYPGAKIDDHGGWVQAHIPDLVVSWAEWNEEGITLAGVHALDQGKALFIEKKNKENWLESSSVKYFKGGGYHISGYDSSTMASWNVKNCTVVQFDGDSKEFTEKMAKAWIKAQ